MITTKYAERVVKLEANQTYILEELKHIREDFKQHRKEIKTYNDEIKHTVEDLIKERIKPLEFFKMKITTAITIISTVSGFGISKLLEVFR